jgi:hypothetical protein
MSQFLKLAQLQFKTLATVDKPTKDQVRANLVHAVELARRVEAAHAVTGGFFGGGMISAVEQVLSIATPLVAIYGDFELSNLLGSLKVWIEKKKWQEAEEERKAQQNSSATRWEDLNFTYTF